jgi:hypothetical protein
MSLGSIPRQRKVSDAQFVGDLMGLLKRHRIESAEAGGFAQFESYLASKDAFRSQLFTLCTAISHMADEDLSGEELLGLICRAMGASDRDGVPEIPDGMRTAFLTGYDAWSNRSMGEQDVWPPERKGTPINEPIPFPQPTEALPEPEHGLRVPGLPTVQEALLMAKRQAPFELPLRVGPVQTTPMVSPNPAATTGSNPLSISSIPGANVENLTINELTQLLEDIERRMSRIKPHMHELSSLIQTPADRSDRVARTRETGDSDAARAEMTAAVIRPSLVPPRAEVPLTPLEAALTTTENLEDDPFVARHAYLNPKRRYTIPLGSPAPLFAMPTPPPPPTIEAAAAAPVAAPVAAASAEPPKIRIIPISSNVVVEKCENVEAAIESEPDLYRILIHIAIGVLAAVILIAIPLAGLMVYRSLHTRYEYQNFQPAAQPVADPTAASPDGSGANPNSSPAAGAPVSNAPAGKGVSKTRTHPAKHNGPPPVAVWPPPPPSK